MKVISLTLLFFLLTGCNPGPVEDSGETVLGGESHGYRMERTNQPIFVRKDGDQYGQKITFRFINVKKILKLRTLKVSYFDTAKGTTGTAERLFNPEEILMTKEDSPLELEIDLGSNFKILSFTVVPSIANSEEGSFAINLDFYVDGNDVMVARNMLDIRPMNMWIDNAETKFVIYTSNEACLPGFYKNHRGVCEPLIKLCSDKIPDVPGFKQCSLKVDGQVIDCHWLKLQDQCITKLNSIDKCEYYKVFTKSPASLYQGHFEEIEVYSKTCRPEELINDQPDREIGK